MKESFSSLMDSRQQAQVRRNLFEIIAMTIVGVIANCDGRYEIEDFCRRKEAWLRERMELALEHDIPLATVFARACGQINPEAFKKCFDEWTGKVHENIKGEVISIDRKTMCGSNDKDRKLFHIMWCI